MLRKVSGPRGDPPKTVAPELIGESDTLRAWRASSPEVSSSRTRCGRSRYALAPSKRKSRFLSTQKKTLRFRFSYHSRGVIPRRHLSSEISCIGLLSRTSAVPSSGCRTSTISGRRRDSMSQRRSPFTSNLSSSALVLNRPSLRMLSQLPSSAMW